jgi:hypothetical protein
VPARGGKSCYVFVACMDWVLATIKLSGGEPVSVPIGDTEETIYGETIFADDASLYSASVGGMQTMVVHVCCSVGLLECVRI